MKITRQEKLLLTVTLTMLALCMAINHTSAANDQNFKIMDQTRHERTTSGDYP